MRGEQEGSISDEKSDFWKAWPLWKKGRDSIAY